MPRRTNKSKDERIIYKVYDKDCIKTTVYLPLELDDWLLEQSKKLNMPRNSALLLYLEKCKKEGMELP